MVGSGVALADTVLHQTGQRRQYADRRIQTLSLQGAVKDDLSFGDVAGQVGDRVCDVVVGHGEDRDLGNGTGMSLDHAGSFVQRSQIGIEIAGIALSAGDLSL